MNSEKTQIARKTVSAPTRFLVENEYVYGKVLHFGEGKAFADTTAMDRLPNVDYVQPYDPNSPDEWKRELPLGCTFDYVVCNYVLNTLLPEERADAFTKSFLKGIYAVYTVRIDKVSGEPYEDGVITSKGTFQTQLSAEEWIVWFHETIRTVLLVMKYYVTKTLTMDYIYEIEAENQEDAVSKAEARSTDDAFAAGWVYTKYDVVGG
jgi:hypothetical protein